MFSSHPGPAKFGVFEFDAVSGELRRRGLAVRLTPQAATLLRVLIEKPAKVCTREAIRERLWPGQSYLDFEHGLNKIVHSLREALGDTGNNPRFIETVAAQGYRFIAESLEASDHISIKPSGDLSLAILPIDTNSQDPEVVFHGRRITSALVDAVSSIPHLRVLAEATVRCHAPSYAGPQRTGEMLGVRAVLWGEMIAHQKEIFLRMELIDVTEGTHLGGASAEVSLYPATGAHGDVAKEILLQLQPVLLSMTVPSTTFGISF
jgi:DNA-binding winged helix-turn-helix (wHTH) protein